MIRCYIFRNYYLILCYVFDLPTVQFKASIRLSYMIYLLRSFLPMAVLPNSFRRFDHFLALTVPSAEGF